MAKTAMDILGATPSEGADGGQPTQDQTPQTVIENKVEPNEGGTQPPTEPAKPTTEQPKTDSKADYMKWFNETFQTTYEKEDDIKGVFGKLKDYETKVKEYEPKVGELQKKLQETEGKLNPLSWFKDESEFRAQQLKIKYPDKNPSVIQQIVGQDLKAMEDLEVLALQELIDNPNLNKSTVEAVIKNQYGMDLDAPDEDAEDGEKAAYQKKVEIAKARLAIDANKARRALSEFSNIELPKFPTTDELEAQAKAQRESLREKWTPQITKLTEPTTLDIKDQEGNALLSFEIPEGTTRELKDYLESLAVDGGMDLDQESIGFVASQREKEIVYKHLPEMLKAYGNQIKSEVLRQKDEEDHNTQPPNTAEAPDQKETAPDGMERFLGSVRGQRPKVIG